MTVTDKSYYRRLCENILSGHFNYQKYYTSQPYFGKIICVTPLHCSYGQIGYTINFPYTNAPEVQYDWEMNRLTIDGQNWYEYLTDNKENMKKEILLSPSWLNGEYEVSGYSVCIDSGLSFACFEKDGRECYAFQGDEGDKVIDEINTIYNDYTSEEDALTQEQAIEKWISMNL